MSVVGANVMFVSLPPRIERDCTRVTPGTMLTASSIGRVMLNSTCRAPSDDALRDDRDARERQLGIDRRRQLERGPDAGAAQHRDREIDEPALLREQRRTASASRLSRHGLVPPTSPGLSAALSSSAASQRNDLRAVLHRRTRRASRCARRPSALR